MQRYEPYQGGESGNFAAVALNALTRNEQTHGFRYTESHLPLEMPIYVLGVTVDGGIGAKPKKGQGFVISTKSEEARAAELGSGAKWMLGLGLGALSGRLDLFRRSPLGNVSVGAPTCYCEVGRSVSTGANVAASEIRLAFTSGSLIYASHFGRRVV